MFLEENRKRLLLEKKNRERKAAIEREKKEAAEKEQMRIEKLKEKEKKISSLTLEKENMEKRIKIAESKGYIYAAEKYTKELKEIVERIKQLEDDEEQAKATAEIGNRFSGRIPRGGGPHIIEA